MSFPVKKQLAGCRKVTLSRPLTQTRCNRRVHTDDDIQWVEADVKRHGGSKSYGEAKDADDNEAQRGTRSKARKTS